MAKTTLKKRLKSRLKRKEKENNVKKAAVSFFQLAVQSLPIKGRKGAYFSMHGFPVASLSTLSVIAIIDGDKRYATEFINAPVVTGFFLAPIDGAKPVKMTIGPYFNRTHSVRAGYIYECTLNRKRKEQVIVRHRTDKTRSF